MKKPRNALEHVSERLERREEENSPRQVPEDQMNRAAKRLHQTSPMTTRDTSEVSGLGASSN